MQSGVAEDGLSAYRVDHGRRIFERYEPDRRAFGRSTADFDLRSGTSGSGANLVRTEAFSRGSGRTLVAPRVPVRHLLHGRQTAEYSGDGFEPGMSSTALVELTIDGNKVSVAAGTTVFDAARLNGIAVPTLCHQQNETPVGVVMVENTNAERVHGAGRTLVELLMADHPSPCTREQHSGDCELEALARRENLTRPRFAPHRTGRAKDSSSPSIAVDFDSCILCDRCVRGCSEIRDHFVLARMGKGTAAGIAFDDQRAMGESSCVSCGECMVSCPTGALTNKSFTHTALGSGPSFEAVPVEELQQLPFFQGVSGTFLSLNRGAVVRREFKRGDIICREGEYGSTAFYILEGKARVSISNPMAHVKTKGAVKKFLGKLSSKLAL